MHFEFATPTRIVFGWDTFQEAGKLARELGVHALVVTGRDTRRADPLLQILHAAGLETSVFPVPGEPTLELICNGAALARNQSCDCVVAFGGGSAIDAAKAIAAMMTNPGDLTDYLEVIGRAQPLTVPPAPTLAIPTTAGTGTEVTRNAVLSSPEHRVKVSLRGMWMAPRVAVVDPALTLQLPPSLTATTGLDALTQVIEPYLSCRANPLVDALCVEGMRRAARSLRAAFDDGSNRQAREDMALASLFGGLALANAGLGAVHGFAAPIGGMFPVPHGAVCAALLPSVMRVNLEALSLRAPQSETRRKFDEVARILTGSPQATALDGVRWITDLARHLQVQPLGAYGMQPSDIDLLIEKGSRASSMKGNPLPLTPEELRDILNSSM